MILPVLVFTWAQLLLMLTQQHNGGRPTPVMRSPAPRNPGPRAPLPKSTPLAQPWVCGLELASGGTGNGCRALRADRIAVRGGKSKAHCSECLQDSHCQVRMSNLSSVIKTCSAFNMPSANLVFLCNVLPIILPLSWS